MVTLIFLLLVLAFICVVLSLIGVADRYNLATFGLLLVIVVLLIGNVR